MPGRLLPAVCCFVAVITFAAIHVDAAADDEQRVRQLEEDVQTLRRDVQDAAPTGLVMMLFGTFCALWAQNTGRSAWLWFFLGLFFSVITVLVLLYKNSANQQS